MHVCMYAWKTGTGTGTCSGVMLMLMLTLLFGHKNGLGSSVHTRLVDRVGLILEQDALVLVLHAHAHVHTM